MLVTNHGKGKELFVIDGQRVFINKGDNLIDDELFKKIKKEEHYKNRIKSEENLEGIFSVGGSGSSKGEKKAAQITAEFEAEKKKILEGVEDAKKKVQADHDKKVKALEADLLKANNKITTLEENLKKKIAKVNPPLEA
jgi:hypothetical protein